MASLHALPVSSGRSLAESRFRERYLALFGPSFLAAEVSLSGPVLDSFFRPRGCLARAQQLAAKAFGADATLFVTCGTTTANAIALRALAATAQSKDGPVRVLADRTCHQSLHFGLETLGVNVDYCRQRHCCERHGRSWPDVADLIDRYARAAAEGRPYDVVVVSAGGYDGAGPDLPALLSALLDSTDEVSILVDEAWSGINAFHPNLRQRTALAAAAQVMVERPGQRVRLAVTHSAHKSMSALRQGSYLHVRGDDGLIAAARTALYRMHTTSPSLPILASLDLARAQAECEGEQLLDRALALGVRLRHAVATDPELAAYRVVPPPGDLDPWVVPDPTKLLLDVDVPGLAAEELRLRLAHEHGLYAARTAGTGLLVHLHIGVTPEVCERLLQALRDIAALAGSAPQTPPAEAGRFLIAYPPGIPLRLPGEAPCDAENQRLTTLLDHGAELFYV
jgi:arginine/lysine/ornithine decarboxylase